ncbi:MAG: hypothetical protein EZS28_006038 [Streblomastix strix]|uniref:Uncharacterized protein n=1 Tax=Streblomastix strix TaxID=222440 RepID=A0A5J4WUG1_9EUKA|nr:MAG: hypothetical protein EZS28_006038 [Streblomastix strix]
MSEVWTTYEKEDSKGMTQTEEVQAGEPLKERLINRLNMQKMIGAKVLVVMVAQPMTKHKGSQEKLEWLCSVSMEESNTNRNVNFKEGQEKELRGGVVGKWRKISDCKMLNEETVKTHFKMDGVRQVMESMQAAENIFWVDKEPCYFLQRAKAGDQRDQVKMEYESIFLYRRYSAYGLGQVKAWKVYFLCDEFLGGVGLAISGGQELDNCEEEIRVSGMGLEFGRKGDLHPMLKQGQLRRSIKNWMNGAKFFEDIIRGCVFTSECDQQVEDRIIEGGELVRQVLLDEEDQRRFDQVVKESQRKLAIEVRLSRDSDDIDNGCQQTRSGCNDVRNLGDGLNSMGGGRCVVQLNELALLKLARIDCGTKGNRETMASQEGDVLDCQQDQGVLEEFRNRTLDEAYIWVRQSNRGLIKQIGEKQGLLNRLTCSRQSDEGAGVESVDRWLRDQVEQAVENVFSPIWTEFNLYLHPPIEKIMMGEMGVVEVEDLRVGTHIS